MRFFNFLQKREVPTVGAEDEKPKQEGASVRAKTVHVRNADSALAVNQVLHAINLRATSLAMASLEYQRNKGGEWVPWPKENIAARRNNYILQVRPNRMQTAMQMWEMFYRTHDVCGRAALHLMRTDDGEIGAIWPCKCSHLLDTNKYQLTNTLLNKTYEVDARDAIVISAMATADRPEGASMLLYAVRTLSLGATAEQFALDTMSKGGTFKGILKQESVVSGVPGIDTITDKEAKKAANSIQEQWDAGADIATDPSAGNLQQVSQSFQDLQVPIILDKVTEGVGRIFGVPMPLMFCNTNAVYKSADDAWHVFERLTLKPILKHVEQEFNCKVLNEYDFGKHRYGFSCEDLCLDSDKSKAETNNIYVAGGIMTPNEARARLGLPPVEGGDRLRGQLSGQQTTDNGQQSAVSNE